MKKEIMKVSVSSPYAPCVVYLPSFTIRITVRKCSIHGPMGSCSTHVQGVIPNDLGSSPLKKIIFSQCRQCHRGTITGVVVICRRPKGSALKEPTVPERIQFGAP